MTLIPLESGFWLDRGPDALNTGRVSIGTRANATLRGVLTLLGVLLCLPTAPALPLKTDFGASRRQL